MRLMLMLLFVVVVTAAATVVQIQCRALIHRNSNRQFVVMNDVCAVIYCVRR